MKYISIILSLALVLCLAPMPYGYYQLIRFIAMAVFAYLAYTMWNKKEEGLSVTFGALAVLFQPFVKIALGRTMWNVVDVAVATSIAVMIFKKKI